MLHVVRSLLVAALVAASLGGVPAAAAEPLTISGTVVSAETDDQGNWTDELAPASTVDLLTLDSLTPVASAVASAVDGSYVLDVPGPGTYRIRAQAPGFVTEWFDGRRQSDASHEIMTTTSHSGRDIRLVKITEVLTGTVRAGEAQVPLAGVRVTVKRENGGTSEVSITDANGHYEIVDLPDEGIISFRAPEGYVSEWYDDSYRESTAKTVVFDEDLVIDALLTDLSEAGTVSGTIRGSLVAGGQALPVAGASASLYTASGVFVRSAIADASGSYNITGVGPGAYRLYFSPPTLSTDWVGSIYVRGRQSDTELVVVGATENVTVDATLKRATKIAGTVFNGATGQSVSSATVFLSSLDGTFLKETTTRSGRYEFLNLAAGAYIVGVAGSSSEAVTWFGGALSAVSATPIVVASGVASTGKNITLAPAGRIRGKIAGSPALTNGTAVYLVTPDGQDVQVDESSDGDYGFARVKPGEYRLRFEPDPAHLATEWWRDGTSRATSTIIRVRAGATVTLGKASLAKVATGTIVGRVSNGEGTVVEADMVGLAYRPTHSATVDESGGYVFRNLPPGKYHLTFADGQRYAASYGQMPTPQVTVASGRKTLLATVTLRPIVRVDVAATASLHSTVAYASFYTLSGELVTTVLSDEEQAELPTGRYKVLFQPLHENLARGSVWLGGGSDFASSDILDLRTVAPASITAALPLPATFTGSVISDARGEPVSGLDVDAWQLQPNGAYERVRSDISTKVDGTYTFTGLSAGSYKFAFVDSYGEYRDGWYGGASQTAATAVQITTANAAASVTRLKAATGTVAVRTPTIAGAVKIGKRLTAKTAYVWPATGVTQRFAWFRDGVAIARATSSTYSVTRADLGKEITVRITGSRSGYTSSSTLSLPRNSRD